MRIGYCVLPVTMPRICLILREGVSLRNELGGRGAAKWHEMSKLRFGNAGAIIVDAHAIGCASYSTGKKAV